MTINNFESNGDHAQAVVERIRAETEEIRHRTSKSWYQRRFFIESLLAAIIASGLLSAWFINYLSPLLTAENELALLKAKIANEKANYQELVNEAKTRELNLSIRSLTNKLNEALELNKKIEKQQKISEQRLKKESKKYADLKLRYEQKANRFTKGTEQYSEYKLLSSEVDEKLQTLRVQLTNLTEQQKETKIRDLSLQNILTTASLNGLWKSAGKIDNRTVYIEFLPKGAIRTYAGLDGEEFIFSNQRWYLEDGNIVIQVAQDGKILKSKGKLEDGSIVGVQELSSGSSMPWILERVR